MKLNNLIIPGLLSVSLLAACTKLKETPQNSIIVSGSGAGNTDPAALLTAAYNDLNGLFHNQDQLFSLEETTSDECLVPTRGGDWDDNGVWRVLHAHAWDATHGQSATVFSGLGLLESDATSVLAFNPTAEQAAEATFLRSMAQFYYLDLYGQVPYRTVAKYNSIDAAPVMSAAQAIDTLVTNLTGIIPILSASNTPYKAGPDAARFLLMKVLLNKGAFLNKQTPTFDNADMAQVIALGQQITAGNYSLTPNFFDNFGPSNATTSKEMILAYPNNGTASNNGIANGGIAARWMMTLHYNSWDKQAPNAGWNGFATVADFYNTFGAGDTRVGGQPYAGVTNISGLRPGLLIGQQLDENGNNLKDRKGHNLYFAPHVQLVETNPDSLEIDGIRVVKYPPDYKNYTNPSTNQLVFFRLADVKLMIAEAQLRSGNAGAGLALVNELRAVRGAAALGTLDATTLLAERGRELYWESWRRQDLIRFGAFLQPWALKDKDDPKYLLFPIPSAQLIVNPNLKQNPGY